MIVKARGIKKSLGIKYAYFVSLTSLDILFIMISGSIMALITLALESNDFGKEWIYIVIFFSGVIISAFLFFILPRRIVSTSKGFILDTVRDYMDGVAQIKKNKKDLSVIFFFVSSRLILFAIQFFICFSSPSM